jgi:TolB-like protein/Flp pilus assembly protein TadD
MRLAVSDSAPDDPAAAARGTIDEMMVIAGRRVGNYELIDTLARGGMGIVYRARQLTAGRVVALKVMLPHLLHMPGMLHRFRQEVEAVAQLDHPGILPIYEVGEHDGLPYFSMKLAEGGALDTKLDELSGDWRRIAAIMAKVARAVEHAHQRGVLHRDLKPANILFDLQGDPMVADFGLAKFHALERGLTLPTSALGSPHYMAPEQVSAQFGELGPASDVYSLGAVLYELLTGRPPISGDDAAKTLHLVPTVTPESGVHSRPELPADLDAIALKCLAKRPAQRYPSAAALAEDLERWLAGSEASALRQARMRRVLATVGRIGIAAVLVAMIVGGALAWRALEARRTSSASVAARARTAAPRSLAVLPFRNLDGNARDDYLTSSVTDDLLYELRQVASLAVVPFRVNIDTSKGFRSGELASQLGVDLALDGDFNRQAQGIKVHARLWDANSGQRLWQYEFDAPAGDPREIRTQIATTLVTRLQIEVGSDVREQFGRDALTTSAEAYDKYLRARYLIRWRRIETLAEAARLLRQAIELDPKFARAHSALAYNYALWIGPAPPQGDHWVLAREFARHATALDSKLGEPFAVLGNDATIHGDLVGAEGYFRKAMAIDSHDPATLHFYTIHLYSVGHLHDALEMERRSVALDGSSPQPMMWLAMLTTSIGDTNEARRLWAKSDELGAAHPLSAAISRLAIGQTEFLGAWYPEHWPETKVPEGMRDATALVAGVLEPAKRPVAMAWLRAVEPQANPAFVVTHYALLEAPDEALRVAANYRLADDIHYLYQLITIWSPRTANMRSDPRFGELMKRWGFVDYWQRYGEGDFCALSNGAVQCH